MWGFSHASGIENLTKMVITENTPKILVTSSKVGDTLDI